jgi:UDP-glucose 4-epimerase
MPIAVTGGSGRLGRAVIAQLHAQGHAIRNLDRVAPDPATAAQADYIAIDLNNLSAVKEATVGCTAIIHLAAYTSPFGQPDGVVYTSNTTCSYNVLAAAASHHISHVCLASSIHALGNGFRQGPPTYHYFPVDEEHSTYCADEYSLSKWVMEQQAFAFARRYPHMTIASLRLHALVPEAPDLRDTLDAADTPSARDLWGYTLISSAAQACIGAMQASYTGHEVFYIIAPRTSSTQETAALIQFAFPGVPLKHELPGHCGLYDTSKALRLLGWRHAAA